MTIDKQEQADRLLMLNSECGLEQYVECGICNNKGFIYYYDDYYLKTKKCECVKQRKMYKALADCGISKSMLEKCTFENFIAKKEWQIKFKSRIGCYMNELTEKKDSNKWLSISSISGSGKTHLCTAVFQECIKLGMECKFMLWKDEMPNIMNLKKSSSEKNMLEYQRVMDQLKNVEVLYIDDFLKLTNNFNKNTELDIAYEIINARYNNDKRTIISTEYQRSALLELDLAITGRLVEKSKEFFIELKQEEDRNYRIKGE